MKSPEKAVDLISEWPAARHPERETAAGLLAETIKGCEEAIGVWREYLANPGEPGSPERSIMTWIGPERGRRLHGVSLRAQERVEAVCKMAGPPAARFAAIEEDLIEPPYRQLKAGQGGLDAAREFVARLEERIVYLCSLIERLHRAAPRQSA